MNDNTALTLPLGDDHGPYAYKVKYSWFVTNLSRGGQAESFDQRVAVGYIDADCMSDCVDKMYDLFGERNGFDIISIKRVGVTAWVQS